MIRVIARRTPDGGYLENDRALELDGVRDGPARWSPYQGAGFDDVGPTGRAILGYDVIVAAPRAASILVAVGDNDLAAAVVAGHRSGVRSAIDYLAASGARVRISGPGIEVERPAKLAITSFTHGVNRSGEPHVHDHVLIANTDIVTGRGLDSRRLVWESRTADALYRAELRRFVNERHPMSLWRSFSGIEYADRLDEAHRALWPGRANDRGPKVHWRRDEIVAAWERDLAGYEPGPRVIPSASRQRGVDDHQFVAALAREDATISRSSLIAALANAAPRGIAAPVVVDAIDAWLPDFEREGHHIGWRTLHNTRNDRERWWRDYHQSIDRSRVTTRGRFSIERNGSSR